MLTTPTIKYYDHFIMKEIPAFIYEQSAGQKEVAVLKKEVTQIIRGLYKIDLVNFGMSISEKSEFLVRVLKDYLISINAVQVKLSRLKSELRSFKMNDEEYRNSYKISYKVTIGELYKLIMEVDPIKEEAKSFLKAVLFVSSHPSTQRQSGRLTMDFVKPLSFVFYPIRKLVQYSQS